MKTTREQAETAVNEIKQQLRKMADTGKDASIVTDEDLENIIIQAGFLIGSFQENPVMGGIPIASKEGGQIAMTIFFGGYLMGAGLIKRNKISFAEALKQYDSEQKPEAAS